MAEPGHYPEVYDQDFPDPLLSAPCSQSEIFSLYPAYRKARDEMQELKKAQKNVELFFAEEKDPKEKSQTR